MKLFKPIFKQWSYLADLIVVIAGILIALSLNNWNTTRQNIATEKVILEELKRGLVNDKITIHDAIDRYKQDSVSLHQLDSLLKIPDYKYSKELNLLFGKVYGIRGEIVNNAFYEDFKLTGLPIIRDHDLRVNIVNFFEFDFKFLNNLIGGENSFNETVIRPYYLNNFTDLKFRNYANPIDLKKFGLTRIIKTLFMFE